MVRRFDPPLIQPLADDLELVVRMVGVDAIGPVKVWIEATKERLLHQDVIVLAEPAACRRFAKQVADEAGVTRAVVEEGIMSLRTALSALPPDSPSSPPEVTDKDLPSSDHYEALSDGIVRVIHRANGATERVRLTNFTAHIVEDVRIDDDAESRRVFRVVATVRDRRFVFDVPAERFAGFVWPAEYLGPGAIVYPSPGVREHLRVAVQTLSGDIPERVVYAHTGWRCRADSWVYLHAAGAIGSQGRVRDIDVLLPEVLERFNLPEPAAGKRIREAVQASLGILDVGPDVVTYPCLAAVYRAPLGESDFSLHLAGPSGVGKTELAALLQQHWGQAMDARHLPAGWDSTGNALEVIAHAAKDALLVVDDFAPTGSTPDVTRRHRDADRLLRAQGNRSGRARLGADSRLYAPRPPRGLIISTGEDVPRGHSVRARILVLEVAPDAVIWKRLGTAQREAAAGRYADALAGYLTWLAERYDVVQRLRRLWLARLRQFLALSDHPRTAEILANLAIGLHLFLRYARWCGALSSADACRHWHAGWKALRLAGMLQAEHHEAAEPTRHFLGLVRVALARGLAHVASAHGDLPPTPSEYGWWFVADGPGEEWHPRGTRIGWLDGEDLYLDLDASYAVAQECGRRLGEPLALTPRTLGKRLGERKLLAAVDPARESLSVRRTLDGARRNVLHLHADTLVLPRRDDQPDHFGAGNELPPDRSDPHASPGRKPSRSANSASFTGELTPAFGTASAADGGPQTPADVQPLPRESTVTPGGKIAQPMSARNPDQPDHPQPRQLNLDLGG